MRRFIAAFPVFADRAYGGVICDNTTFASLYGLNDSGCASLGNTAGLEDDRHISTIDPDGIALAGAKAHDDRTTALQAQVDALQRENAELRERLERLEKLLTDHPHK